MDIGLWILLPFAAAYCAVWVGNRWDAHEQRGVHDAVLEASDIDAEWAAMDGKWGRA